MQRSATHVLKSRGLNGWRLFAIVALPTTVTVAYAMSTTDLSAPQGVSTMIQLSVRLSVPWLFVAFAASSVAVLAPGPVSFWLLRNRRIFGLCFACAMAWQLFFILWLVTGHWSYYASEVYSIYDLAEQLPGYLILAAMTVTSFDAGRRRLTPRQWKLLHKGGIYFLWGVVWSTYWFELYYYDDIQALDYVYYWAGFLAWTTRAAAWSKQRAPKPAMRNAPHIAT
ncbi:MAG: hypothetical protein U5K76_16290 [Woeseiaceae bacterium]|nr:hypothetical protein [Woeseiaceae bacterium]